MPSQICVRVPEVLKIRLEAAAGRRQLPMSEFLRQMLTVLVDNLELGIQMHAHGDVLKRMLVAVFSLEQLAVMTLDRVRDKSVDGRSLLLEISQEAFKRTAELMEHQLYP